MIRQPSRRRKYWVRGCCVAIQLLVPSGCTREAVTAPSPPVSQPAINVDGLWIGKTAQAGDSTPTTNVSPGYFAVAVVQNRVTELTVQVSFPAPCRGELTATWGLSSVVAADGSFTLVKSSVASTVNASGVFTPTGEATGSITVTYGSTIGCVSTVSTTWMATRSSNSTP